MVDAVQGFELRLHMGLQGEKLGLVAAFPLFGEGLEGFALALIGLLAEGVTLLEDPHVKLELLLALVLAALEPTAQDLQKATAAMAVITRSASSLMREARVIFRR